MAKHKKEPTLEQQVRESVRQHVRYGFYRPGEIARIVGKDVFDGAIARDRLGEMIAEEFEQKRADERSWPIVTDCDRLDEVFASLNKGGILALHNAGFEPSDGITEVSEQYHAAGGKESAIIGYCFYHRQDIDHAIKSGELSLAYGDIKGNARKGVGIGRRVRQALEKAGFEVAWTGSIKDKLAIKDFRWQRRRRLRRTTSSASKKVLSRKVKMDLELESGRIIHGATADDVLSSVEGEDFAILSKDADTYIQCAEQQDPPYEYILEYQDGSLSKHYQAVDGPITLDRVLSAFLKYLKGDLTWRSDFSWEKVKL